MRKAAVIGLLVIVAVIAGTVFVNRRTIWPLEEQIGVQVQLDPTRCQEQGRDVLVGIANRSSSTVQSVNADIEVGRKGYSNGVASDHFYSDKIMPPGAVEEYCVVRPGSQIGGMSVKDAAPFADPYRNLSDSDLTFSGKVTLVSTN